MEIYQALILGIVQGLTELLPISSSAHLTIIPWIFNWNIPEYFDVALHFGTLLAIVLYFFKDWIELIKGGFLYAVKKEKTVQGRMFWYIVLATIPGGIIGFILDKFLEDALNRPIIIAVAVIVMGIILYIVDKKPVIALIRADKAVEETKLMNAVGGIEIRIASSAEIAELMAEKGFDAVPGFIGPKGMKDVKIIRKHNEKCGYKLVITGFIPDNLAEDLEMLGDDLEGVQNFEISEKLRRFKKFHRKENGLVIRYKEYFQDIPKYEFDIEKKPEETSTLPSIPSRAMRRSI